MKKILALSAAAVMSLGVVAFAACDPKDDDSDKGDAGSSSGLSKLTYTSVDLSKAADREAFIDELVELFDVEKLFGTSGDLGFEVDYGLTADVAASAKAVPLADGNTKDLSASVKYEMSNNAKLKLNIAEEEIAAYGKSTLKLNATVPNELYDFIPLEEGDEGYEYVEAAKEMISKGLNYSITEYIDGENVYIDASSAINSLPDTFKDMLEGVGMDGGKYVIPLGGYGDYENDVEYNEASALSALVAAEETTEDPMAEAKSMIDMALTLVGSYGVEVGVNKADGYAVKVSANAAVLWAALDEYVDEDIITTVKEYVTLNSLALNLYLAVDKDGGFKEVSMDVSVDAKVTVDLGELVMDGLPTINGTAKLGVSASIKSYTGTITSKPSDADKYVSLGGSAEAKPELAE